MRLGLKTKLSLMIVSVVLFTGIAITVGFSVLTFTQSAKENRGQLQIASQGFFERFNDLGSRLKNDYIAFQNDKKLNANIYHIIAGDLLEFHMIPEINNLGDIFGVENFAFYYQEKNENQSNLHLYYSRNLGGNVIISEDQHKLYAKGSFGSSVIDDPGLFPSTLPEKRKYSLSYSNGSFIFEYWNKYQSLIDRPGIGNDKAMGHFCLQKEFDFDVTRLEYDFDVDFAIYDKTGKVLYSRIDAKDIDVSSSMPNRYYKHANKQGVFFDALLLPIGFNGQSMGYLSVNISIQKTIDKIFSGIILMSIISAIVITVVLLVSFLFIQKLTSPISKLSISIPVCLVYSFEISISLLEASWAIQTSLSFSLGAEFPARATSTESVTHAVVINMTMIVMIIVLNCIFFSK